MTVGAQQSQILRAVVPPVTADVVDFEAEGFAVPFRPCAARRADFTDPGTQELSEQPFTGNPSVLGAAQGERAAERALRASFARRGEVGSVDSERGDPATDVRLD